MLHEIENRNYIPFNLCPELISLNKEKDSNDYKEYSEEKKKQIEDRIIKAGEYDLYKHQMNMHGIKN